MSSLKNLMEEKIMASVIPKFVTLKLSNVAPKPSDKAVIVESVSIRPEYDKTSRKAIPDSVDGFNLTFFALRSGSQTVKLPKEVEPQIKKNSRSVGTRCNCFCIIRHTFHVPCSILRYGIRRSSYSGNHSKRRKT